MIMEDQTSGCQSNSFPEDDGVALEATGGGEGLMPKIRKPYTITKQRERWTEEEHKRFLEALKLYGRAWRKIEEHVGSKNAVQIRSHAQKFFCKVSRDSGNSSDGSVKPIEIPPPRPKRKPMHPYPRKLVMPQKKGVASQEQLVRSTSPNSSEVGRENQSPTSVLSAVASDILGSADSSSSNRSTSPASSDNVINNAVSLRTEGDQRQEENSTQSDDILSVKLELFPKVEDFVKEGSAEATTRSLKLFGKTVEIPVLESQSSQTNSPVSDVGEDLEQRPSHANDTSGNSEYSCSQQTYGMIPAIYFMSGNMNASELASTSARPWWSFCGGLPFSFVPFRNPDIKSERVGSAQEKELLKEGSWSGSDTGSVNGLGSGDRDTDAEAQSNQLQKTVKGFSPYCRSQEIEKINSVEKPLRGFVPYKRCISDRDTQSLTITSITTEEKEGKRTRLCL